MDLPWHVLPGIRSVWICTQHGLHVPSATKYELRCGGDYLLCPRVHTPIIMDFLVLREKQHNPYSYHWGPSHGGRDHMHLVQKSKTGSGGGNDIDQ